MLRRLSLGTLLVAGTVLIVVAAVACLLVAGSGLLRNLSDDLARARVRSACETARQAVGQTLAGSEMSARLLAERPTLARLLAQGAPAGAAGAELQTFLDRFARTSGLGACLLARDGRVMISGGELDPAPEWIAGIARGGSGGTFLRAAEPVPGGGAPGGLFAGAFVPFAADPAITVLTVQPLGADFAARLTAQVGLPVRLETVREAEQEMQARRGTQAEDPVGDSLRVRILDGSPGADELSPVRRAWVADAPLGDPALGLQGLIEVELPVEGVEAPLRALDRRLLLLSLTVAALTAGLGALLARRLVRPLASLTASAQRIGEGDLATPVDTRAGGEVGALAGTMEGMRLRLMDLTAELRLRRREADAVLTGIVEGVFSVDRERKIRYLNQPMAGLLGVGADEAIGRFCGDVLRPVDAAGARPCETHCPILDARFRGRALATESIAGAGGGRRSVVITSSAPGSDGSAQFQVARDETELEAGRRLRDLVVANISHEFRTPLSAQLASIELLKDRMQDQPDGESAGLVHAIERGTLRLTRLIDNLLESARIEAGRDTIRRGRVALDEVVEEAADLAAPLLGQRGQQLEVNLPYPLPEIEGDAQRLVQVFVNLLANANKFAPEGSTVRIGGTVAPAAVTLWVEDEGPGLPAEGSEALFDRFVRSPVPIESEPGESGMGLGLWIVRSIVTRHGGAIEARAARPSSGPQARGTRMIVTLPRVPAAGSRA